LCICLFSFFFISIRVNTSFLYHSFSLYLRFVSLIYSLSHPVLKWPILFFLLFLESFVHRNEWFFIQFLQKSLLEFSFRYCLWLVLYQCMFFKHAASWVDNTSRLEFQSFLMIPIWNSICTHTYSIFTFNRILVYHFELF